MLMLNQGFSCDCAKKDHGKGYNMHWSFGNTKLKKDGIVSFNIPAFRLNDGFKTCPNAGACALVCYALQGRYIMASVAKPRDHNIAWLRSHSMDDFVKVMVEDIGNLHPMWTRIRVHDSGDFYSEAYLEAWLAIARACPSMKFYAYTKMVSMTAAKRGDIPDNFTIVQSVGGKEDRLIDKAYPHSVIFPTQEELESAGYIDGTKSDRPAFEGQVKIGLVYHGTKGLTENNANILRSRMEA